MNRPADVSSVLEERARRLARPLETPAVRREAATHLVFTLGGERYAVELGPAEEVFALRDLTPVPGTPPTILGVVNHHGRILAVVDLRHRFGLARPAAIDGASIVAVTASGATFGILAESIEGTRAIAAHELMAAPAQVPGACVRGVTADLVTVLDPDALARDPRIVVGEEVRR